MTQRVMRLPVSMERETQPATERLAASWSGVRPGIRCLTAGVVFACSRAILAKSKWLIIPSWRVLPPGRPCPGSTMSYGRHCFQTIYLRSNACI
jgi:hypothetical protein